MAQQPSKTALQNVASELSVEGRSGMEREELAAAIVESVAPVASPEPEAGQLAAGMIPRRGA